MKKILLLICLLPLFSYAQKIPDFGFNKVRIADGDKIIQAETLPVSSMPKVKADRLYFWYSANIIHSTQGGYSGKLLNGNYTEYYHDKNLKEQGNFKDGLKMGRWENWNESGILISMINWESGLKRGKFIFYNEDGKIKQAGKYKNDQLVVRDSIPIWKRINIFKKKKKS